MPEKVEMLGRSTAEKVVMAADVVALHKGSFRQFPSPVARSSETLHARVTNATPTGGLYACIITVYDATEEDWFDVSEAGDAVVLPANGETLTEGIRYPVKPAGETADGEVLYVTLAATAGTAMALITDAEVDGYYPALLTEWSSEDEEWVDGDEVLVKASNDEELEEDKRYLVRRADTLDEVPVYTTDRFPELDSDPTMTEIEVVTRVCGVFDDEMEATPSGPAGGDLDGTYPNPTVDNVNGGTW